jgi:hypothetical protein
MPRPKLLALAAALLIVCAVGSTLTRHSHGATNILSNIFFFTVALLVFAFALAAAATGIKRLRTML